MVTERSVGSIQESIQTKPWFLRGGSGSRRAQHNECKARALTQVCVLLFTFTGSLFLLKDSWDPSLHVGEIPASVGVATI